MDDRKPSVKCGCGHAFDIAPEQLFKDVTCPQCGKLVLAPTTAEASAKPGVPKSETVKPAPKSETLRASRSDPATTTPGRSDPGTKHETTKGPGTPSTARKGPPLFMKEGPLPAPIPGYTFLKRLGQGGMGEVFLAKQESLDRNVAIKLLPPEFAKDKTYVQSFMKEARSAGKVTHENIMGSIDVGESNGRYYFVMEYVQGETLFRLIKQQKTIPEAKALDIARQVARGLRHAFAQGLIHRDIKPQNILVTPEGQAKVCDFGLATELKSDDAQLGENEENVHTTPAYASPEQCRAEPLDHRTDMYSLGVTLYEMLAGRRPFVAATPRELMTKHVTEFPQPPRTINPAISEEANQLVLRMLKKRKDERPKTYDELIAAFDSVMKSPSPKTVRGLAAPDGEGAGRKKPPMALIAGAAAAVLLILVGAVVLLTRKPAAATAPATTAQTIDPQIQRELDDMRAIQKTTMGRPGEYPALRAKWKALEERYAGTPHRAIFAAGRVDFEAAVNAEAETAAREVIDEATRALADSRLADAHAALRRFPAEFGGTPAGSKVAAKALEIDRAADDRYQSELDAVSALVTAGKLDDARQKLSNLKAASALDGAEVRPQVRSKMDDLMRRIDTAIAEAKSRPAEPASKDPQPSIKPVEVKPTVVPDKTPATSPTAKKPDPSLLPPAAAAHYAVLRSPAERAQDDKRLAAAGYFAKARKNSSFHRAATIFLARDDAAWKLEGAAAKGLQEYLATPLLDQAETPAGLTMEHHQQMLELLILKITESGSVPVDVLQLFALAHLQEIASHKGKLDPALLVQGKFAKGPLADLWGPAASIVRVELAAMLLKPPGLWVPRAAEIGSMAGEFPTRYLGALCTLKDQTFDGLPAIERWKKLSSGSPDPAGWTRYGDAVSDRIKQEMTCEMCLGQGRYSCSSCGGTGGMICTTCRGMGKVLDPSEGTNLTCKACSGRRAVACTICLGAKGAKCSACDGKKIRPLLTGSHYRMFIDLGMCDLCSGSGNLFTAVAFPCYSCDGTGRVLEQVIKDFTKLPAWALKGREGRMLHAMLRWLARHQSPDGSWGATTWTTQCPEPGCKPAPAGVFDLGLTCLTLTAFLNAGIGPESAVEFGNVPLGPVVRKALNWILAQQTPEGLIAHGASIKPVFENNLAIWALFTAYQLIPAGESFSDKDRVAIREAGMRALKWALNAQAKGGGWGYTVGATSDTWVTSWGAMALLAAKDVGVDIPKLNSGYALAWLDSVTDKKDFHLGYTPTLMGKVNLPGNETFQHHDTLSALGSLVRLQLESKPSSTYAAADKLLEKDLPNSDPMRRDYCYWYFGTVFMSYHEQRRGSLWTLWTQSLLREILTLQESADSCSLGSLPVTERWSTMGGKVYASSMNALTLTQLLNTRPAPPAKK
jgi:hypothetical protein